MNPAAEDRIPKNYGRTLKTAEAAEILGRPPATLRYWRYLGKGPRSFTMGEWLVVYLESDVREWLAAQYEKTVTADPARTKGTMT